MRAAVRAARQARWREAARGAAARLLALHTRRPALRRRVAAAAARLRAQEGTPVLLELPPLPPIDLVGLEEGNPVAAEARDAADYEAVCELAATWRTEQSEEAAAAAEEELAFAQVSAWYVHGICMAYICLGSSRSSSSRERSCQSEASIWLRPAHARLHLVRGRGRGWARARARVNQVALAAAVLYDYDPP